MSRTQMAIIPGMVTSFGLGKSGFFFGAPSEVFFIFLILIAILGIYLDSKKTD